MPTVDKIIDSVAALMNDSAQTVYTDAAVLPYFNMALDELEERFLENDISVVNEVSATIVVPVSTTVIGFNTSPAIPSDLIEIQQLWERATNVNPFIPMQRVEFIPHYLEGEETTQLRIWTWQSQEIRTLSANRINDLKIDYIKSIFNKITDPTTEEVDIINAESFLYFYTASLCSMFIAENPTRAAALKGEAESSVARSLNIGTKGRQAINTQRRPYRESYKRRSYSS